MAFVPNVSASLFRVRTAAGRAFRSGAGGPPWFRGREGGAGGEPNHGHTGGVNNIGDQIEAAIRREGMEVHYGLAGLSSSSTGA
jgi:hypothetical protein